MKNHSSVAMSRGLRMLSCGVVLLCNNRLAVSLKPNVLCRLVWSLASSSEVNAGIERAQEVITVLSRRGRTEKRLGPLVDLACKQPQPQPQPNNGKESSVAADIGCDHGLLTVSLAVSGLFGNVIGVDVSKQALEQGALNLLEEYDKLVADGSLVSSTTLGAEFRLGNGLGALGDNESDLVCIAGMGVNTMIKILQQHELERIGCRRMILQPTNSKPRNLIQLYDHLGESGWRVDEERIQLLSSRWYLTTLFSKSTNEATRDPQWMELPGSFLGAQSPTDPNYESYVAHHLSWLRRDAEKTSRLHKDDQRWLTAITKHEKNV